MLFGFFKHDYTMRRFGEETVVEGFSGASHVDTAVALENVQPLCSDELQALPEGERTVRRIKSIGSTEFRPADEKRGTPGDWLFYCGRWYECKSCQLWGHTILAHYESEFAEVPPGPGTDPPKAASEEEVDG